MNSSLRVRERAGTTLGVHLRYQLLQDREGDDAVIARFGVLQHQIQNVAFAIIYHPRQGCNSANERTERSCDVRRKLGAILDKELQNEVSYGLVLITTLTDAQLLIIVVVVPIVRHEPRQGCSRAVQRINVLRVLKYCSGIKPYQSAPTLTFPQSLGVSI